MRTLDDWFLKQLMKANNNRFCFKLELVYCNTQSVQIRFVHEWLSKTPVAANVGHLCKDGNAAEPLVGGSEWTL
jgi:hypothetical protein